MAQTVIRGSQILNNTVQRQDLDVSTVGQALVTKIVQGTNVSLSSTGADSGTGDVTISVPTAVSANANNKATLGSDSLLLVQGTAAGVAATTHAQTVSGDDPQLTNARTPTAHEASHVTGADIIPNASATANGLMKQVSGNTTDFVDGTNNCQPLQPVIWSVRLRSFNAISNPTFEVDQSNGGALAVTSPVNGQRIADRWLWNRVGTHQVTTSADTGIWTPPGSNFRLTSQALKITLTTQEASLAAGDILAIQQMIEGPRLRELINDVHSLQLLVTSSVAGLKFSIALHNTAANSTIVYLCTIPSANTPTLITLPNIPIWPGAGNFVLTPGSQGYGLRIVLAAGTNYQTATLGVWQSTANALSASAQSNFAASPVNSTFTIAFIQHEPGALCTTPIDCSFGQNLDGDLGCSRYFIKSYDYGTKPGTVTSIGAPGFYQLANFHPLFAIVFSKRMAKTPTVTGYSVSTGAAGTVKDWTSGTDRSISGVQTPAESGFDGFTVTTPNTVNAQYAFQYIADTGW